MAAMLMIGCATGYQPKGLTGGYSETRLSERAFEVSFQGNGYTNQLTARRGAMHRAAEIALQFGYYGFWVTGQNASVDTSLYSQPVSCSTGTCTGGQSHLIEKPTATLMINLVTWEEARQAPPWVTVYDARMIMSQGI